MTFRIFNPDHDLALAANREHFTAPHAGRQLYADLGFLPALWADDGDVIIVDDIDAAAEKYRKLNHVTKKNVEFATFLQLPAIMKGITELVQFDPWGWNKSLRFQLLKSGIPSTLLPTETDCSAIRALSSRQTASVTLQNMPFHIGEDVCGESHYCSTPDEVEHYIAKYDKCVLKAPWSSSGRGIRYIFDGDEEQHRINTRNWMLNILQQQGGVMIEPYYNKVKDFAMEFVADGNGQNTFCGLSLFDTVNGAYTGNIIMTEGEKREILERYVSSDLLRDIAKFIETSVPTKPYRGPFGVDMMIVASDSDHFLVHPCVEINLRRTMGHVALSITPQTPQPPRVMSICYSGGQYHFSIKQQN